MRDRRICSASVLLAMISMAYGCNAIFGLKEGTLDTSLDAGADVAAPDATSVQDVGTDRHADARETDVAVLDGGAQSDAADGALVSDARPSTDGPGSQGDADAGGLDSSQNVPDGGGAVMDAMARITAKEEFTFTIHNAVDVAQTVTASLSYSFAIDVYEVSVGRFTEWADKAPHPVPCTSGKCSLDPGGPYENSMIWDANWNVSARDSDTYKGTSLEGCSSPKAGGPTYGMGDARLPITCVTWYQAVAFCAFEGKRLPTEMEWQYVAAGHTEDRYFAFNKTANVVLTCEHVIFDPLNPELCGFPQPVGSAKLGVSLDGLYDLSGSVFEWVWDESGVLTSNVGQNYTGPGSAVATKRVRRGGAYICEADDWRLTNLQRETQYAPGIYYADHGFRCAKTLL